jgi:cephalosporin-C deacetylase-like acetyl esterase
MNKGDVLESWKEISAHLYRNIRTCQLWERDLGLPIHRLDGSPRARVFAFPDELDRWLDEKLQEHDGRRRARPLPTLPRWNIGLLFGLAALAIAMMASAGWLLHRQARIRWANDIAIPEIERLLQTPDQRRPFELFLKAEKLLPRSPKLASLRPLAACFVSIETDPRGAEIRLWDYNEAAGTASLQGSSPLVALRTWPGYKRYLIEKEGFTPAEGAFFARPGFDTKIKVGLDRAGTVPPGMVRIPGDRPMIYMAGLTQVSSVDLVDYFIDRFEVTNDQYKGFVSAGGYARRDYWQEPFIKEGRAVSWDEAMREFVDATGHPGPATWRNGEFPEGQADYPVTGVSWYEAAAYAAYAGKRLPTCFHWIQAAGDTYSDTAFMIPASNLEGQGPSPAGGFQGMSYAGVYDMAGNAKEWCWNEIGGKRLALGAAWNESQYFFNDADRYPPMMRPANCGIRCMMEKPGLVSPPDARRALDDIPSVDYAALKPCSDEVFRVYRGLYAYTRSALDAKVESVSDWSEDTRLEKVSFRNAIGDDRIYAYLFLPRRSRPPYQTVVYFPGDGAWSLPSIFDYGIVRNREVEIFTRGGRAFVFPVYSGTFERLESPRLPRTAERRRELAIEWYRDLAKCLDYLETRPDIDKNKLGYHGLSAGGGFGVIFAALEPRFKAAALLSGGLYWVDYVPEIHVPERDFVNFAPRVRMPILMQNGKYDFLLPWETSVKRLFALLGTPATDKFLVGYESGHSVWLANEYRKDLLDFFDKYLGPVGH